MNPRSKQRFDDAVKRGVDELLAFLGTELIDGWQLFWKHEISSLQLEEMTKFALDYPEAAWHRWQQSGFHYP